MAKASRTGSPNAMIETMTLLPPNYRSFIKKYCDKNGDKMAGFIRKATIYYIKNVMEVNVDDNSIIH
jgi:hypothetical protein